jgi:hypothetical protein
MSASIKHESEKRKIINKANSIIVIAISLTIFISIFSLFSFRALYSQSRYNSRVVNEKEKTLEQINQNARNIAVLSEAYTAFINESINILGGNPNGFGPLDGNNKKLVFDSLPTEYNFTGLSSSIEKILKDGGYAIDQLGGREDATQSNSVSTNTSASPVSYSFGTTSTPDGSKRLLETLERSIRPFDVRRVDIIVNGSNLRMTVGLTTYYAPEKSFEVTTKVVR